MTPVKPTIRSRFSLRLLTVAAVVTIIAISWFALSGYQSYQRDEATHDKLLYLTELQGTIVNLDEVLTMSARMAAATGNPKWERRYHTVEPKLDAAIEEVRKITPEPSDDSRLDAANKKMDAMEDRAFALVSRHRLNEAQEILFSAEYEKQKRTYSQGLEQLSSQLQNVIQAERRSDQQRNLERQAIAFCMVPLMIVMWLITLRAIRQSQIALMETGLQLERKANALAELKATLDQKVAQRTNDIEASRIAALNIMEDATESKSKAEALNQELLQEIIERKQAEATQARLIAILEATPDFVGIADMSQHPIYLNRAGRKMLGMTEDEDITNTSILDNFTPTAGSLVSEGVKTAMHDGVWNGEVTLLSRAGREIPASQVIVAHKTEEGEVSFLSTIVRDITGVKQAAEALRKANDELELRVAERTSELERANAALQEEEAEQQQIMATLTQSEERFRLLVESVHDYAILMLDTTGHIMTWNAGAERMKGYRAEDIIGRHFSCFYIDEDQQAGKPEQELRTAEAEGYLDDEGWRVRRDGSRFWATIVITALRDAAGQLRGFAKVSRDITERKNVEAALHEAKAQADAANLAKSEFLSRMSHELCTPLNAIIGFGQILDRQDLSMRARESVGYILKGGRHLLDLINEILDIARVEAGHLKVSLEPVALHDVVPDACALVQPLAADRNIRLDIQPGPETYQLCRYYILADLQRLKQVLINLLSNAIKYNHEDGQVEISCEQKRDGWISIGVRDTGPGISPQDIPKLFMPFERLAASTSNIEGTGLGLVLSQRLVTAMGGTLSVESTLGQGSIFTIELPRAEPPEELLTNAPEGAQPLEMSKEFGCAFSVLCIEDNPSNLRLMETIFEERPEISLMTAVQGSVGLDLARRHEPDLILLDLDLPDIHGSEVLARLQQSALTCDIPVVVVSADATPNQIERLLSAGAKAYLTKPLDVGQFLDTIDQLLQVTPEQVTPEEEPAITSQT